MPDITDTWLDAGVLLPLRADAEHIGSIVDADDNEILVVDQHRDRGDAAVAMIAELIVTSVNGLAGVFSGGSDD